MTDLVVTDGVKVEPDGNDAVGSEVVACKEAGGVNFSGA